MMRLYSAIRGRVTSPGPARPVFRANTDMLLLTQRLRLEADGPGGEREAYARGGPAIPAGFPSSHERPSDAHPRSVSETGRRSADRV